MKNLLIRLWKEEEGQDLTEYALLLVGVTLLSVASIGKLANLVNSLFGNAYLQLSTAAGGGAATQ
ncbi:MAG TPA: hypothetical protein VFW94_08440 [Candidatus Acidoferrales bacterium]|nr:hypothetical protein [Candidatus Acidoferrales bacterium]